MMVVPVPKPPACEPPRPAFVTFVAQAQLPQHILITSVADYRQHGASAAPHLVVTLYTELAASKGLVMLTADIVSHVMLTKGDGARLVERFLQLYSKKEWYALVKQFNEAPNEFDFNEVLSLWS
jgi:ATP synthase mitochondrial F1 complex assembly factor 1